MNDLLLGFDIGGTNMRAAIGGPDGQLISDKLVRPVPRDYSSFLDTLTELARALETELGRPAGVGLGLPAALDDAGVRFAPALPFLDGEPLAHDLSARLDRRVRLAGDAQCALLAESSHGAARGAQLAVLVTVGTGIGGAILVEGRVIRGANGVAGAFGWLPAPEGPAEASRHGAWEQVASGSALTRSAEQVGATAEQLVLAARQGDRDAVPLVEAYAYALGRGIAAIASCLDPEIIVMAGGLSEAFDVLEPGIRHAMHDRASPSGSTVRVVPADLGTDAGLIGAVMIADPASGGDR